MVVVDVRAGLATDFRSELPQALRLDTTALWIRTRPAFDWGVGVQWQTSTLARWPVPLLYLAWHPQRDVRVEAVLPWSAQVDLWPSRRLSLRGSTALDGAEWTTQSGRLTVWDLNTQATVLANLDPVQIRLSVGWRALRDRTLDGVAVPLSAGPTAALEVGVPLW